MEEFETLHTSDKDNVDVYEDFWKSEIYFFLSKSLALQSRSWCIYLPL